MQSLTFIMNINGVRENPNVEVFDKSRHLTDQKHINYLHWTHIRVAQFISCMIFVKYVGTIQHLNYSTQVSKLELNSTICNLYFWHICDLETKVIKPTINTQAPSKVISMQSLKSCFNSVRKKCILKLFSNKEICTLSPLNTCNQKEKRSDISSIYLM